MMDEDRFTKVMLALGYEQPIIDLLNNDVRAANHESGRYSARRNAIMLAIEGVPYWRVGEVVHDIVQRSNSA